MEVEDSITINEAYASKYEKKKRAEELSKRKHHVDTLDYALGLRVTYKYVYEHKLLFSQP